MGRIASPSIPDSVERQLRIATFFEHIAASTAGLAGEAFFNEFVREVAAILRVRHVSISRYPGMTDGHFRTLAFYANGRFYPNVDFEIEGRPCKYVIDGDICYYPENLDKLFPREAGWQSYLGIPLRQRDKTVIGLILVMHDQPFTNEDDYIVPLRVFASYAAMELERYLLAADVRRYEERQRAIARELHDSVTQSLWVADLLLQKLPGDLLTNVEQAQERAAQARHLLHMAQFEARALLLELQPVEMQNKCLSELMRSLGATLSARTGLAITVHYDCDYEFPLTVKMTLYRILQEALNNVIRHARATHANVELMRVGASIQLTIADDGHGFDVNAVPPDHLGLGIMRERAREIGAQFVVDSGAQGTTARVIYEPKEGDAGG